MLLRGLLRHYRGGWRAGESPDCIRQARRARLGSPTPFLSSLRVMSLTSVASKRTLNDGNAIPCVGFGVYNTRPGSETVQSVLWALEVAGDSVNYSPILILYSSVIHACLPELHVGRLPSY